MKLARGALFPRAQNRIPLRLLAVLEVVMYHCIHHLPDKDIRDPRDGEADNLGSQAAA